MGARTTSTATPRLAGPTVRLFPDASPRPCGDWLAHVYVCGFTMIWLLLAAADPFGAGRELSWLATAFAYFFGTLVAWTGVLGGVVGIWRALRIPAVSLPDGPPAARLAA